MPITTRSIATDFTMTNDPGLGKLRNEVEAAIAQTLISITVDGDDVDFDFAVTLSSAEETTLTTTCNNHAGKQPRDVTRAELSVTDDSIIGLITPFADVGSVAFDVADYPGKPANMFIRLIIVANVNDGPLNELPQVRVRERRLSDGDSSFIIPATNLPDTGGSFLGFKFESPLGLRNSLNRYIVQGDKTLATQADVRNIHLELIEQVP